MTTKPKQGESGAKTSAHTPQEKVCAEIQEIRYLYTCHTYAILCILTIAVTGLVGCAEHPRASRSGRIGVCHSDVYKGVEWSLVDSLIPNRGLISNTSNVNHLMIFVDSALVDGGVGVYFNDWPMLRYGVFVVSIIVHSIKAENVRYDGEPILGKARPGSSTLLLSHVGYSPRDKLTSLVRRAIIYKFPLDLDKRWRVASIPQSIIQNDSHMSVVFWVHALRFRFRTGLDLKPVLLCQGNPRSLVLLKLVARSAPLESSEGRISYQEYEADQFSKKFYAITSCFFGIAGYVLAAWGWWGVNYGRSRYCLRYGICLLCGICISPIGWFFFLSGFTR